MTVPRRSKRYFILNQAGDCGTSTTRGSTNRKKLRKRMLFEEGVFEAGVYACTYFTSHSKIIEVSSARAFRAWDITAAGRFQKCRKKSSPHHSR